MRTETPKRPEYRTLRPYRVEVRRHDPAGVQFLDERVVRLPEAPLKREIVRVQDEEEDGRNPSNERVVRLSPVRNDNEDGGDESDAPRLARRAI